MGNTAFRCLAGALVLAAVAGASPVRAADPVRIGVVDLQRCLNESRTGKRYKTEFTAQADDMKAALEDEEAALKALRQEIEKQGLVLSETARAEKEKQYKQRLEAFKQKFQQTQQALQRKDQELTRKILKDLQGVIQQIGDAGGYTVILERQEGGILYRAAGVDITDEVIRRYDEREGE